jgi:hypothetical protein
VDPLLFVILVSVLYGVVSLIQRLTLARQRRRPRQETVPAPARSRPSPPAGRPTRRGPARVVQPEELRVWQAPAPPPGEAAPAPPARVRRPAVDWRRRLAHPQTVRDAIVAAEILRRPRRRP